MRSTSGHLFVVTGLLLILIGLSLTEVSPGIAQAPTQGATQGATQAATQRVTPPAITDPHGQPPFFLAKYYDDWVKSPHAKKDAEAFVHWNAEGQVPEGCANCHSTPGYQDFLGADGSATGKVDKAAPIGSVINCDACHSPAASSLSIVTFPSGAKVGEMGDSTRCIVCHQGRSSTVQVNAALERAGVATDPKKVEPKLTFVNIHYYAAAASLYGSEAHGGYEFPGKRYQMRFNHSEGFNTCAGCHNPHTLQVKVESCTECHTDVKTVEDLREIRMMGSLTDYDGDGNIKEGIASEIVGLQEMLYKQIQAYATKVSGTAIAYDSAAYPYFFADTNANGTVDKDEAVAANAYKAYTGRLVMAAYNYQMSKKDPGNYAHNAAYHIELLYDSIEALNADMEGQTTDITKIQRNDPGHFDTTAEAWRHWDKEGEVPGTCAKCHTAGGLPIYLKNATNIAAKPSNSMACTTCHEDVREFNVHPAEKVTFPSGVTVTLGRKEVDNICLNCHQGRESTVSMNRAITAASVGPDEVTDKLTFRNVHYFAAGATLFGGEVQGAYQYADKKYNGRFMHEAPFQTCSDCHNTHALKIQLNQCTRCHEGITSPLQIRVKENAVDYDGDGNKDEPIADEIATLKDDLLAKIYSYAAKTAGAPIVYDSQTHPYWFIDLNNNGKVDPDETKAENRYVKWTPNLLRAAYNYQYTSKDPGVFAHNAPYILQVLYDSLESMGGKEAVAKYTRPEVKAAN